VKRSYKYRIYPSKKQARLLDKMLWVHRGIYNDALKHRITCWKQHGKSIGLYDQTYDLKLIRQDEPDVAWCNFHALNRTLRRLDKAYQAFFRRIKSGESPGFPKFKGRRFFNSIEYTYGNGIRVKDGRLYIQNVGFIRMFFHRPISNDAKIKAAVVKRESSRWFVVLQTESPDQQLAVNLYPSVGIDMGLEVFCALSNGELVENPRWFRQSEKTLAVLQKRRARCKRGSKRYRELSRKIINLHRGIRNRRHDFHNQLSTRIIREFGLIAVEDLNIKGLAKSHVSKSIGDAGWRQFLQMLSYKAQEHGSRLVKVNARNTSQLCSACGCMVKKDLSVRVHDCSECGYTANRDVNAARVILSRANLPDRQAA
jgi:putative transposase